MKMIQDEPAPIEMLGNVSKELTEIISDLLDKDSANRITWEELLLNEYWGSEGRDLFHSTKFPEEPQFEAYLSKYGKKKRVPELSRKQEDPM